MAACPLPSGYWKTVFIMYSFFTCEVLPRGVVGIHIFAISIQFVANIDGFGIVDIRA